jgi:transcriptional regulator with XRE-family HTH domain
MTLREYLDMSGWSQRQFAKELGAGDSIVSRWVKGQRVPSRSNINEISQITKGAVQWSDWNSTST